jgi:hypothetical protein
MYEREPNRVLVGLQRGFTHETPDRDVGHQQTVKLLPHQLRLAAQHDLGAA